MPQYEFGSGDKGIADNIRDEFNEHLSARDDARTLTVRIADKAPDGVKDRIEAQATESKRETESRSIMGGPLSEGVREKIKDENGFDANTTVFSWRRAKGVFQREGLMNRWGEAISTLARDYDDPKEGAEDIISRGREADMMKGTSSVSSEMDMGEEDVIEDQKAAEGARVVQSEQCDHAEGHCENGQPEACEFLQETCGYSEEMTEELLETPGSMGVGATTEPEPESTENQSESSENQERGTDTDTGTDAGQPDIDDRTVDDASDWDTSQLTGKEAGALSRSLQGYYGATDQIEESIEDYLKPEWQNAQDAANTIQEIRMKYDAGRQHFEKLEDLQGRFADFVEQMAQDCRECHADHSGHDHDTDMSQREDIRNFAEGGGNATPVGAADETEAAAREAPDRMAGMKQETIDPENRQQMARVNSSEPRTTDPNYDNPALGEEVERNLRKWLVDGDVSAEYSIKIAARLFAQNKVNRQDIKEAVKAVNFVAGIGNRIKPDVFLNEVIVAADNIDAQDDQQQQEYDRLAGMQQGPLPGSRQRVEGAAARARASEREDIERRLIEPKTNSMRANRNRQREIQSMDGDISGDPYEIFDKYHEDNREDTTQENREYERTPDGQIRPYRGNDESNFMRAEQQRSNIEVRGTVADDMKGVPTDRVATVPGINGDTERALLDMGISTVADLYKRLDRAVEEVPDESRGLVKRYAFNTNSYRHTPVPDNIPSQTNPEVMTLDEIDRMAMLKQDQIDPRGRRANVRRQRQRQQTQPQQQPQNVLEQETQQTLGGSQADPQQTFSRDRVGQPNQRESELESEARVDEVNSGGMTADQRSEDAMSETRTTEEATEQQIPDEFITREDGNQRGLDDM